MKTKTMIFITIILTLLVAYWGMSLYNYGLREKRISYDEGYVSGLLYTQQTGNIVSLNDGNLTESTIGQVCNYLITQQGGLQ